MSFVEQLFTQTRLILAVTAVLALAGLAAWMGMPRQEDPSFVTRFGGLFVTRFSGNIRFWIVRHQIRVGRLFPDTFLERLVCLFVVGSVDRFVCHLIRPSPQCGCVSVV